MLTFFLLFGGALRIAQLNSFLVNKELEKFRIEKDKNLIVNLTVFITILQTLLFIPTFLTYINGTQNIPLIELNELRIISIITIISGFSILIAFLIKSVSVKYFFVIVVIIIQAIINFVTYFLFKIQLGSNELLSFITTFSIIILLLQEKRFKSINL